MQLEINQQQQKLIQKQRALDERAARDEKVQQYLDGALEQALQELARRRDLQKQEQHQREVAQRTRTNPQHFRHSNQSAPSQQRARYAQPATHAQQQTAQSKAQHQHREPNQAQPRRYSRTISTSRINQQLSSMAPQGNGGVRLQSAMSVAAEYPTSHQRAAQPPKRQKSQPASNSRSGVKANTATGSVHSQLKRQRKKSRSWVSKSGVGAHSERAQAHRKGARSSNKYLNAVKMGSPRSATGTAAKRYEI